MTPTDSLFSEAISNGNPLPRPLYPDGKIHRFPIPPGKDDDGWYIAFKTDDLINVIYGCWRGNTKFKWCSKARNAMSREEWNECARAAKQAEAARAAQEAEDQAEARKKCDDLFHSAPPANTHPYLTAKGITAQSFIRISNLELTRGWLAIPLQDIAGTVHSAQFIADDGTKRFLWHGRVQGCFHLISRPNTGGPLIICEGYATGASLHAATGWTVACAMNCGNLLPVAQAFRQSEPTRTIIIASDNDQFTDGNPGLAHARKSAESIKAFLALPEFGDNSLAEKPTDFNDLHRLDGLPAVRRQIHTAIPTLRILAQRQFNPNIKPPPLRPIYTLDEKVICTPGNLSSITSTIKTGKSSVICAMIGSAFPHNGDCDLLSFDSSNPKNLAVLHFDSEQSPDDHWHQIHRILRRVHLPKPPPWFYSYCLTGLDFNAATNCFLEAMRITADTHGGIHSAFLDGIADFVSDVNDAAECNAFIAQLQDLAIQYQIPIPGVIHFNPGSDKSRGHLGSQFERKAETNLRLDKINDITTIWSEKQRRSPIPKGSGPSFTWSDDLQMHVSCSQGISSTRQRGAPSMVSQIASMNSHEFLASCPASGESRKEISRRLESWLATQSIDASFETCRRSIIALVANSKLRKDPSSGLYFKGKNA